MRAVVPALCLGCALAAPPAAAAIAPGDIEPTGPPNAAYLDAVRWSRLQTEVTYLRPSAPFDPRASVEVPAPPMSVETRRWIWIGVLGALILGIVAGFAWFGGRIPVTFGATDRARRGAARAGDAATAGADLPPGEFLERLRAMADRRAALILLTARALEQAAAANGLTLARAQTARDVLRAVPRRWPHFEALRRLVREAEIVHFGGRDLPEARWRDCLETARPLIVAGPA